MLLSASLSNPYRLCPSTYSEKSTLKLNRSVLSSLATILKDEFPFGLMPTDSNTSPLMTISAITYCSDIAFSIIEFQFSSDI